MIFLCLQKNVEQCDKYIAWLEKQGEQKSAEWHKGDEQNLNACLGYIPDEYLRRWLMDVIHVKYDKPTDKVEPKFHKGQWIVWQDECYKVNYNGCGYELVDKNGLSILLDYGTIDENAHLWNVAKDAKDGDVLVDKDDNIGIYEEIKGICWHSYIYLSFDNYLHGFSAGGSHVQNNTKPATKEQRDLLFQKIEEAGYMWDAEKKELKKIEKKLTNSYCQEHCKGFQETGKCFVDGDCKAKTTYKDELKEDNRPVTERIKTFDDACQELDTKALSGDETAAFLLADYESNADNINNPQTLAYMRLAIIVYALNEGWVPQFTINEYRFSPWFYLYTKEEYDQMDEEKKGRCVLRSGSNSYAYCGFVNVFANFDASLSSTYYGSRLALRTRELAEYAGKQFIEEWADFVFKSR